MITLKKTHNLVLASLFSLFTTTIVTANEADSEVYANDWKSPETIIDALYNIISAGPNGKTGTALDTCFLTMQRC